MTDTATSARVLRYAWLALLVPLLVFMTIFFVYPLVSVLQRAVSEPSFGVSNFERFWDSSVFLDALWNTAKMSVGVTALCLLLGYPYAYLMTKVSRFWSAILLIAVLIPFWSSVLVRTYAWTVILQKNGVVNDTLEQLGLIDEPLALVRNFTGIMIGMTHVLLPLAVLPMYSVMRTIDDNLPMAAESLGATPRRAFWTVYLPNSLPGVYAGGLLVMVVSLGYYITPALLGSPRNAVIGEIVVQQVQTARDVPMAATLSLILLGVVALVLVVFGRVIKVGEVFSGGVGSS